MEIVVGFAIVAVAVGFIVWRKLKDTPSGGFMREKQSEPEPIAWRVERRKQFAGEPERDSKGVLIWYPVDTYPGSGSEVEARARARAIAYSEKWNVLTQFVPVDAGEEG